MTFMEKVMNFMNEKVTPKVSGLTKNPYLGGLQAATFKTVSLIMVSSIVTIYNVVAKWITLPDISLISTYTFGLCGLLSAYMIAFCVMEKKGSEKKFAVGVTSLALYLMTIKPEITDAGYLYDQSRFGAGGTVCAIFIAFFTVFVFGLFEKVKIVSDDSMMPDFVKEWFNTILPVFTCIFLGWLCIIYFDIDFFAVLVSIFAPIVNIANTFPGMLLMLMIPTIFYTMGISGWLFSTTFDSVMAVATDANVNAALAGATSFEYLNVYGVDAHTFIGGRGNTLPLNLWFLMSKSKRLKGLGKAFIVPSIMNINEPIIFGCVVWNPILMIPVWIVTIVNLVITYICMATGLVQPPHVWFSLWYAPTPIYAYFVTGVAGVILNILLYVVDMIIFFPFFKVYEKQVMIEDGEIAA